MSVKYSHDRIPEIIGRQIFFDTNIIIYLFWPTGKQKCENEYATVFKKLMDNGNRKLIDLTVISEVFNRAFTTEFEKYKEIHKNYKLEKKAYRDSQAGQDTIEEIYALLKNTVFKYFEFVGKSFSKDDILGMLIVDQMDFSDKVILKICRENDLVLLTNDFDFKSADIDILTANTNLVLA
jgi:predicted nucleic acid-binding protein